MIEKEKIILVTGASGFIGSHLVQVLVDEGKKIRCLVSKTNDTSYLKSLGVELVYGDLLDRASLKRAVKNVSVIYHLAAKVRPHKVISKLKEYTKAYLDVNLVGTKNLIEVSLKESIQKFIYYSSIAAVGAGLNLTEKSLVYGVTTCYGKSKLKAEKYILSIVKEKNFPAIIIRPGQIYGPKSALITYLFCFIKKGFFPLFGKGSSLMPMCYIDDLIRATILAEKKGRIGSIYFIVEKSYSLKTIISITTKVLERDIFNISIPNRLLYIGAYIKEIFEKILNLKICLFGLDISKETVLLGSQDWTCSNEKARDELGFIPQINLESGIQKTIDWYKNYGGLEKFV